MALRLWKSFRSAQRLTLDRLRGAGADRSSAFSLREKLGQESLTFSNSLHFDGSGLECLLHPKEPLSYLPRECRDCRGASTPDPAREGNRYREQNDQHEQSAENVNILWQPVVDNARELNHSARNCSCLGDLRRVCGQTLVDAFNSRIDVGQMALERLSFWSDGHVFELAGDVTARALKLLELVGQLSTLRSESFVNGARARRTARSGSDRCARWGGGNFPNLLD